MTIVKAKFEDIEEILEIVKEQRQHLKDMGIPQWQGEYPSFATFDEDVKKDRLYVAKIEDKIVGFFALIYPDHCYDYVENGKWSKDTPYIAVHRLGVSSSAKRKGVASEMFNFVKERYDHVRMDTHEVNEAMNACAKKNGFKYIGVVYMEDKTPRNAYEWFKD